jgi:arylsulfatase
VTIPVCSELDDKWADYSEEFIRSMAKSNKPFFLYHCTRGAHFDNYPNPKFKGKSASKYPYKDTMIELDDILGRLVKALEETGQLENTLIFVTSDNGPQIEIWPDSGYTPLDCLISLICSTLPSRLPAPRISCPRIGTLTA